jgi:enoyl-CoA hydratase
MTWKYIELNIEDAMGHIVLNRSQCLNALNGEMVHELRQVIDGIAVNRSIRSLVISGAGGNFAAGADIADMVDKTPDDAARFVFNPLFNAIEDLPVPVIAAISGYALGGGLELALACDLRICSENASLGFPEINLGIFPGGGGTQRLPRLIGPARAKEMIFTGQRIDGRCAGDWGLCNRAVEGDPLEAALELARICAKKAPLALRSAKRAIAHGVDSWARAAIHFEEEAWSALFATEDQKEGMRAFLEKRKPQFKGK